MEHGGVCLSLSLSGAGSLTYIQEPFSSSIEDFILVGQLPLPSERHRMFSKLNFHGRRPPPLSSEVQVEDGGKADRSLDSLQVNCTAWELKISQ